MTSTANELPRVFKPPIHRGMTELDRSKFTIQVPLVAAKLQDPSIISALGKRAKDDLLSLHGISRVVKWKVGESSPAATSDAEEKGVLLRHDLGLTDVPDKLSPSTRELLDKAGVTFVPYTLELGYDYWKAEEILEAILPEDMLHEIPTGFTVVGHIAHLNVRDEYLPYKYLIGQIVLDKNPLVETVVNKLDSIHAVYRTFDMEVIAGKDDNFEVEQSESGCRFRFNFKQVYWNSRLHTEHARLVDLFKKGEAVCDVFAGVGPFAIPAGRKGVIVFANDLNPDSYASLEGNVKLNKTGNVVFPYNEDGRKFIEQSSKMLVDFQKEKDTVELFPRRVSRSKPVHPEVLAVPKVFAHYVMNLPDSALTFLDAFAGIYSDKELRTEAFGTVDPEPEKFPLIHVHCFHKHDPDVPEPSAEQIHEDLRTRINQIMGANMPIGQFSFHKVRKVAPTKVMYCVSFRLPKDVACR